MFFNLCSGAYCKVRNTTSQVIDIQTFDRRDKHCEHPESTLSVPPGEIIKARVQSRGKGLKIGVIFNQWASGYEDHRPGCKLIIFKVSKGQELCIERVERNYREETPESVYRWKHTSETSFVECRGQKRVEKHGDYWYKKAPYSWQVAPYSWPLIC